MATAIRMDRPAGSLLRGHMPAFMRDRIAFLEECQQAPGDAVPLRFGPRRALLVKRPEDIERVLVREVDNFPKLFVLRNRLRPDDTEEPEEHHWPRAGLARSAFHRDQLATYSATMSAIVEEMLDNWQDGETRDIMPDMLGMTLDVVVRTMFGVDVRPRIPALQAAMDDILAGIVERLNWMFLLPDWMPTRTNRRARKAMGEVDALLEHLIPDGVADRPHCAPMLAMLHAGACTREIDYHEARQEALAMAVAGHESSALTLTWLFYLLDRHPDVAARLTEEVDSVLAGRRPTPADRAHLPYTEMVIQETLRYYPPVWLMARRAARDTTLGGQPVAAGTIVLLSQWLAHRDPEHFTEPERFNPDRWRDGLSRRLPRYAFFPFSGGPRVCLGSNFAMHELMLLVPAIVQRFQLTLDPGHVVALAPIFTLRPSNGMRMRLTARALAAPAEARSQPRDLHVRTGGEQSQAAV